MRKIIFVCLVLCSFLHAQDPSYNSIASSASKYDGKSVKFEFHYAGKRAHISPAIANHGVSGSKYVQLVANDAKLTLLIKKNSSVDKGLEELGKRAKVLFGGKVDHWNSRRGDKFYYVTVTKLKIIEKASKLKEKVSEERESPRERAKQEDDQKKPVEDKVEEERKGEPNRRNFRNRFRRNSEFKEDQENVRPASKTPLRKIMQSPAEYAGKDLEFSLKYNGHTDIRMRAWQNYSKLKAPGKVFLVFKNDSGVAKTLEKTSEGTLLRISGKMEKMNARGTTLYIITIFRAKKK